MSGVSLSDAREGAAWGVGCGDDLGESDGGLGGGNEDWDMEGGARRTVRFSFGREDELEDNVPSVSSCDEL